MTISIPKLSLVVLVGPSGSGKSTFARKHFLPTEIVSSDDCRAMVSDDENDQAVTPEAFALLHYVAAQRLALGRLTVIDATNVQPEARALLLDLARLPARQLRSDPGRPARPEARGHRPAPVLSEGSGAESRRGRLPQGNRDCVPTPLGKGDSTPIE